MYEQRAKSALEFTQKIIAAYGPRLTGSKSCAEAAKTLENAARQSGDSAKTESFIVHPDAFLGFIRVLVVLYALSAGILSVLPVASLLIMTLGIIILVGGFILYRKILDPFYPAKKGYNVIANLEPSAEVTQQLIISGHHDSAKIFNFYIDKPELYARRIYGGIGAIIVLWAVSFAFALFSGPPVGLTVLRSITAIIFLAILPIVLPLWNFASDTGTPGAGDNLISSAAALEIMAELKKQRDEGKGLTHTRIIFASFDAEEAGLRGARAFACARKKEFSSIPSYGYNMDCLYNVKDLLLLTTDLNGSIKMHAQSTERLAGVARECGFPVKTAPISFLTGGTDAAELARAGVRATSLVAMRWDNNVRAAAYHTPGDVVDAIEGAVVEAAIRMGIRFAHDLDANP